MTGTKLVWSNARDREWAATFESAAIAESTTTPTDADGWLLEVHDAVSDSGQRATDLFGAPESAVADFVGSLPIERRAAHNLLGQTLTDVVGTVVCSLGLTGVALAIAYGARDGWQLDVSRVTIGVALAVILGSLGAAIAWALRTAGRTTAAASVAGVAVVSVIGSVVLATWSGDRTSSLFTLPTLVPGAVGAALFVAGWIFPSATPFVDDRSKSWTATQWFTRFEGLLRGRYHLPPAVVGSHLREARQLLETDSSVRPFEEFGAPETYALALAEGDSSATRSQSRAVRRLWTCAAAVLVVFAIADIAVGTYNFSTAVFSVAAACCAWQALSVERS